MRHRFPLVIPTRATRIDFTLVHPELGQDVANAYHVGRSATRHPPPRMLALWKGVEEVLARDDAIDPIKNVFENSFPILVCLGSDLWRNELAVPRIYTYRAARKGYGLRKSSIFISRFGASLEMTLYSIEHRQCVYVCAQIAANIAESVGFFPLRFLRHLRVWMNRKIMCMSTQHLFAHFGRGWRWQEFECAARSCSRVQIVGQHLERATTVKRVYLCKNVCLWLSGWASRGWSWAGRQMHIDIGWAKAANARQ